MALPVTMTHLASLLAYHLHPFARFWFKRSHLLFSLGIVMAQLLDAAMAKHGGRSWALGVLDLPACTLKGRGYD